FQAPSDSPGLPLPWGRPPEPRPREWAGGIPALPPPARHPAGARGRGGAPQGSRGSRRGPQWK
ncbi:hypothetical protein HGM15179_020741, partial [Zosterops borbonicus]